MPTRIDRRKGAVATRLSITVILSLLVLGTLTQTVSASPAPNGPSFVSASAETQTTSLPLNAPVSATFAHSTDVHYYQVSVAAGRHLFVVLDGAEFYAQSFQIYIRFGSLPTELVYDDKGDMPNSDQAVEITSTTAGKYYVMVRFSPGPGGSGDYTLTAHTNSTFPTLTLGTPLSCTGETSGEVEYYQVAVTAGRHLLVVLDGTDGYLQHFEVYVRRDSLPSRTTYDDKWDMPDADQAVEIPNTQAGYYYIMVRHTSGAGGSGDYTLTACTNSTFPTLTLGTRAAGSAPNSTEVRYYQIRATAGRHLGLSIDGPNGYLQQIRLYVRFGALPNMDDYDCVGDRDGTDQAVEIPSTQAGYYYVMVRHTSGAGASGIYSMATYDLSLTPTVTALSPNHGAKAAGARVTVTGTNLLGATAVRFGSAPATDVFAVSSSKITCKAPSGLAGKVDVIVITPTRASSTSGSGNDYYYTTICQQSDTRIKYSGTWSPVTSAGSSGGSYAQTRATGAYASIKFNGTRLYWIAAKGPAFGDASVSVDGRTPVVVHLYSVGSLLKQTVWDTGALAAGTHTMKITWKATSGKYIDIDALLVSGSLVTP